jgi:S-phase kinase-associated protein 1
VNVAKLSVLIKDTIEGDTNDDDDEEDKAMFEMPLPNVTSETLQKVIDYCTYYVESTPMDPITTPLRSADLKDLVQTWYTEYVDVSRDLLFDLVAAANFMDM